MPAKSKAQQRFMGMVHGIQKGTVDPSTVSAKVRKVAKGMKKKSAKDYASTKHKGKPEKVKKEERDYKDEYKKFQSSTKSKKYRAELNQYNRKKGTYGNGDGKDASHKGGKIAGFEKESINRGRAEKSRLKKEGASIFEAKFTDDTLAPRIKHWANKHKGTGIGYGHVLGQLAVHMKELGWNKSYKEVARIAVELSKKKKVESVGEGFGGELKDKDKKKFEKTRKETAEVLGYKLTGKSDVNEEITDWQGKYDYDFKFKKGQLVKDINPDCPHVGSEGEVTKVTKDEVTYTVRNNGKTYKVGDELTKTKEQLTPLSINESKIKYYKTISKKEWSKTPKDYKSVIDGVKFKLFLDRQKGTILAPVKVESVNESGILYKAGVKKYGKEGMAKILSAAGKKKSHAEIGAIKDKYEKESVELDEGGMGILDKDQTDVLHAIVMKNKNKNSKAILKIVIKDPMFKRVDKRELLGYIEGAKEFVRYMGRTGNESINEKMGPEQFHKHMQYVFDTQFKTPEEKKMKKSIIKKINKSQKKKGLPLFKEERDYRAEYQARKSNYYEKYQSSTKAKKYRAELNQYNRKRGTYGNGDGMDASHKGGKIVGFEKESTNRSRREKSRLKKRRYK